MRFVAVIYNTNNKLVSRAYYVDYDIAIKACIQGVRTGYRGVTMLMKYDKDLPTIPLYTKLAVITKKSITAKHTIKTE